MGSADTSGQFTGVHSNCVDEGKFTYVGSSFDKFCSANELRNSRNGEIYHSHGDINNVLNTGYMANSHVTSIGTYGMDHLDRAQSNPIHKRVYASPILIKDVNYTTDYEGLNQDSFSIDHHKSVSNDAIISDSNDSLNQSQTMLGHAFTRFGYGTGVNSQFRCEQIADTKSVTATSNSTSHVINGTNRPSTNLNKLHPNGEHYHHEEHHINQKVSNRSKILTSLMAGGIAGALAKTTIAPLDRTKINFQTSEMKFSAKKALQFLVKTYKNEGFLALWRGNSATMVRIVPYAAIQFTAHEQYKLLLNRNRKKKHLPPPLRAVAGSMAGITASSFTYPLDFARARMAVTAKEKYGNILIVFRTVLKDEGWQVLMRGYTPTVIGSCVLSSPEHEVLKVSNTLLKPRYGNILIVFRTVLKDEGWRVLMRGYTPTVIGSCVYSGISFYMYETLKIMHAEHTKGVDPTPFERWCCGAVAGICGQCTSYPLDIVRRRMQTAGVTDHTKDYTSIYRTAKYVYTHEGLKGGLYKGLSMNWIKGPISAGISFMVFDTVQRWLRKWPVFHTDE